MSQAVLFLQLTNYRVPMALFGWLTVSAIVCAQTDPAETPATTPPLKTVATSDDPSPADQQADATTAELPEKPVSESFQFPVEQHAWARFQLGAWRELQITSETFDATGEAVSRSVTRQKEVLQAVADGKYVLNVQATVDLSGKRIVGDWKTRILHFATDGAGQLVNSRRLGDEAFQWMGRTTDCQVWQIHYRDGDQDLTDRILYDPLRFPYVLQRETYSGEGLVVKKSKGRSKGTSKGDSTADDFRGSQGSGESQGAAEQDLQRAAIEAEQRIELTALSVPYLHGEQLLECSCVRTFRRGAKGDTLRLTFSSRDVPGGTVAVLTTDSDAEGLRVRSSMAQLLAYGEAPDVETPSVEQPGVKQPGVKNSHGENSGAGKSGVETPDDESPGLPNPGVEALDSVARPDESSPEATDDP